MDDDAAARLADSLVEVEELRAELARLRGLLGLESRHGDGYRQAWAPTLFAEPGRISAVDSTASMGEKVAVMRSLFGARSDVYATRWENASTRKSGWSPAVRGGWAQRRATKKDYLPLSDEVLSGHLRGEVTVGIYPLLRGDRCTLLACDFDGGSWVLDALAYLDACHRVGVPAALERSRSGDGAHVWVFFDGPVPATAARSLGSSLLREAMAARAELDLSSYDRFFPSQDFMPNGSFGNLIALPLHGERLDHGATAFLDPTTLQPWPDRWAFLSSVARLAPEAGAIVEDQCRTAQICADVHRAVAGGRTCLVLTQRTDHIDAIVDGLAKLGDEALVLRGGLGKRARDAVGNAIASRPDGTGIVLVATGSYLGEGFDWPELDTLFLAFPIAFKGRVVQYVGRLLRAYGGKHHVELHDYVDVRIPVLDRMHIKRLPAYATLGFDVPRGTKTTHHPTADHEARPDHVNIFDTARTVALRLRSTGRAQRQVVLTSIKRLVEWRGIGRSVAQATPLLAIAPRRTERAHITPPAEASLGRTYRHLVVHDGWRAVPSVGASTGRRCLTHRGRGLRRRPQESLSMSTLTTTAVERYQPILTEVEQTTLLGYLAGYRGFTREAYALDLRQFTAWCWQHDKALFDIRRVDIECFARDLEDRGKARATVGRRLCTVVGFYRYAEEEGVIENSPAVHIRRPRIDYESHVAHLDRNELGAILVTAGLSSPRDHALVRCWR